MDDGVISLNDNHDNEQLLKAMGFNDEHEIRQALSLSKNDINEAVAYLTNEKMPKLVSSGNDDNEIIMSDSVTTSPIGPQIGRFNSNNNNNNTSGGSTNENFDGSNPNNVILCLLLHIYRCRVIFNIRHTDSRLTFCVGRF